MPGTTQRIRLSQIALSVLLVVWTGTLGFASLHLLRQERTLDAASPAEPTARHFGRAAPSWSPREEVERWPEPEPAQGSHPAKHVVVIGIDTLRPDHLSAYGYPRETSPNLTRMAADEGIVFEKVYASSSWTLPSVTSIFTSLHPPQHGVEDRGSGLSLSLPTLAGSFAAQGWVSAAFVTHVYVSSIFGLDRGFLEFEELSIDRTFGEGAQLTADAVGDHVLPWLDAHASLPFFLYFHLFDPHWDYSPPAPWNTAFAEPDYDGPATGKWNWLQRFLPPDELMGAEDLAHVRGLYDGEIAFTDAQIARILDRLRSLGIWDDTLVVILSDHGEEFQEHGSVHHIRTLYEEVVRVPLIVKPPGGRASGMRARVSERVRNIDIAPTLLAMSDLRAPPSFEGQSLVPLLTATGPDRDVFMRTVRHGADRMALIEGRWKLVYGYGPRHRGGALELYDLEADPGERHDLADSQQDTSNRLRRRIDEELEAMLNRTQAERGREVHLDPTQLEGLRSLGYIE